MFFLNPQPWFVGGNRRVVGGFELVLCDNIHFSMFFFFRGLSSFVVFEIHLEVQDT